MDFYSLYIKRSRLIHMISSTIKITYFGHYLRYLGHGLKSGQVSYWSPYFDPFRHDDVMSQNELTTQSYHI